MDAHDHSKHAHHHGSAPSVAVKDPVCGMTVLVTPDALHAVVEGEDFWFCGPGCLTKYTAA